MKTHYCQSCNKEYACTYGDRCERDYKGRHYFEKLGVMMLAVDDYVKEPHLISRCTQCLKCKAERLEFLEE